MISLSRHVVVRCSGQGLHDLPLIFTILLIPWFRHNNARGGPVERKPDSSVRGLYRDDKVQFREIHRFGRGTRIWLTGTGTRAALLSLSPGQYADLKIRRQHEPVRPASSQEVSWWWYHGQIWRTEGYEPDEIPDLIRKHDT